MKIVWHLLDGVADSDGFGIALAQSRENIRPNRVKISAAPGQKSRLREKRVLYRDAIETAEIASTYHRTAISDCAAERINQRRMRIDQLPRAGGAVEFVAA